MRRIALSLVVLFAMTASTAHAATVNWPGGPQFFVAADSSETNTLTLTYAPASGATAEGWTIHDATTPVTIGVQCTDCTQPDANTVFLPSFASPNVQTGNGNSSVTISNPDFPNGNQGTIAGGDGNDTLSGGVEGDQILGGNGNDTLTGGRGADTLYGGPGNDTERGGASNDDFATGDADGSDTVDGGSGNDLIEYAPKTTGGVSVTEDGVANDGVSGEGDNVTAVESVSGTTFADTISLTGTTPGGSLNGNGGDDNLSGSNGPETISGGAGNDTIKGNAGGDNVFGGPGNDSIAGGVGNDTVDAGAGNDTVDGGSGDDLFRSFFSGDGADAWTGGAGADSISYEGDDGPVTITQDGAANDGEAGEGDNVGADIEQLVGSPDSDTITGGPADNRIQGDGGSDTLSGGDGNDTLFLECCAQSANGVLDGGNGNDRLFGGDGDDMISGGPGNDMVNPGRGGADVLSGGPGLDTASFSSESCCTSGGGVNISPDGVADDGLPGQGANVGTDVENLDGTTGPDTITGAPGVANLITGQGGGDVIDVASDPADRDQVFCRAASAFRGFSSAAGSPDVVNADALDRVSASGVTTCATINRKGGPQVKIAVSKVKPTGNTYAVPVNCVVAHPRCNVTAQAATPKGSGLGSTRFTIANGKTGQALFHLSSTQKHNLLKGKKVKVKITVNAADSTGKATTQKTITLHQ